MTANDELDRTIATWLDARVVSSAPPAALEHALADTRRQKPRPALLAGLGAHWVGRVPADGRRPAAAGLELRVPLPLVLLLAAIGLMGGVLLVGSVLRTAEPATPMRLAYGSNGDIYVAGWDGANPVRVADGAPVGEGGVCGSFWSAGWAPDGRHFAYRSGRSGCDGTVLVSDPDGTVVASFAGTGWLASWSPDSTRIATWVELSRTIGIYGTDGTRQALLRLPDGHAVVGDRDPVWSPDGRSVLIRLQPPSPSQFWELPVDGRAPRRVPDDDPRYFGAVYSPDKSRAAYVPYLTSFSLVIAEADGTIIRVLPGATNSANYGPGEGDFYSDPVWSPTGDRVAVTWSSEAASDDSAARTFELRIVDVTTGEITSLVSSPAVGQPTIVMFSPAGDRLLFDRGDGSLWTVTVDGSELELVVEGADGGEWQPQQPEP